MQNINDSRNSKIELKLLIFQLIEEVYLIEKIFLVLIENVFCNDRWHQYCNLLSLDADMLEFDTPHYDSIEVVVAKKLIRENA